MSHKSEGLLQALFSERFSEFKRRWRILNSIRGIADDLQRDFANRESPSGGLLEYLLDALCLPFHVLLRGKLGRNYLTFGKIVLSSLFFLFCLCLVQFRFETELFVSPFTPGGFRILPEIILPESFGAFVGNLADSWRVWMHSFKPRADEISLNSTTPQDVAILVTSGYYSFANLRLILSRIADRLADTANIDSSGEPAVFGLIPFWQGLYTLGFLLNFKTDIVKQYVEPLLLFIIAQFLLSAERPPHFVFPGICLYIGSAVTALQAFIRSLPIREEADDLLRAKFRNEARESHMKLFDLYAHGSGTVASDLGPVTSQPVRR